MKKKPHLHDGTVMVDMDRNGFIEIPPSVYEPPDVGLTRNEKDSTSTSNSTIIGSSSHFSPRVGFFSLTSDLLGTRLGSPWGVC